MVYLSSVILKYAENGLSNFLGNLNLFGNLEMCFDVDDSHVRDKPILDLSKKDAINFAENAVVEFNKEFPKTNKKSKTETSKTAETDKGKSTNVTSKTAETDKGKSENVTSKAAESKEEVSDNIGSNTEVAEKDIPNNVDSKANSKKDEEGGEK